MAQPRPLRVVILKPAKYSADGYVERFRRGVMPKNTIVHLASLMPPDVAGARCEVATVDEYVHGDLGYLDLLRGDPSRTTLLALVGRDRAADYALFRRRLWGFDLAPLPANLALSAADEEVNRHAKLRVVG